MFTKGDPAQIVDSLVDRIVGDKSKLEAIVNATGDVNLKSLFEEGNAKLLSDFIDGKLTGMLQKIIVNTKTI